MMGKPNEKKVVVVLMRKQWPHVSQRPRNQDEERDTVRALSMALRFAAVQRTDMDDPAKDGCGNLRRTHARVNQAGYARYDEKTSRMLADTSNLLMKRYHGDLRDRREAAERDPARVNASYSWGAKASTKAAGTFFLREVQTTSAELQPFDDAAALEPAGKLDLAAQES